MKQFTLLKLVIGILIFYGSIANALSSTTQNAIGHYVPTAPGTNPWPQAIILHNNGDGTWSNQVIPWEKHPSSSEIFDTLCMENNCISTVYNLLLMGNHYQMSSPFFLMSNNHGTTWYINKNISGLPEMRGGFTKFINCIDHICLSIGTYEAPGIFYKPMFLKSYNDGQSWAYSTLPFPASHDNWRRESLHAMTCTNNACIIAGSYLDNSNGDDEKLLFFYSNDKGKTWLISENIFDLPSHKKIDVNYIKCNTSVCLASGSYSVRTSDRSEALCPLILLSKDKGKSWNFIVTPSPASKPFNLVLHDIVESNGTFIIVGVVYVGLPVTSSGFMLLSHDNARSWTLINKKLGGNNNELMTALNTINCTNNICIAGGDNNNGLNLMISHDHGLTWKLINKINGIESVIPTIDRLQCNNSDCTAFGSYTDGQTHPIVLMSNDDGETWYANKNILNFPQDQDINELRFTDIK